MLTVKRFLEPKMGKVLPKIDPIKISVLGAVSMAIAGVLLFMSHTTLSAIFVLISGMLDVIDGTVARKYGMVSSVGSAVDRLCDRISDSIIVVGMGIMYSPLIGMMTVLLTLLSSYSGAIMEGLARGRFVEKTTLRPLRILVIATGIFFGKGIETLFVISAIALYSFLYRLYSLVIFSRRQ